MNITSYRFKSAPDLKEQFLRGIETTDWPLYEGLFAYSVGVDTHTEYWLDTNLLHPELQHHAPFREGCEVGKSLSKKAVLFLESILDKLRQSPWASSFDPEAHRVVKNQVLWRPLNIIHSPSNSMVRDQMGTHATEKDYFVSVPFLMDDEVLVFESHEFYNPLSARVLVEVDSIGYNLSYGFNWKPGLFIRLFDM